MEVGATMTRNQRQEALARAYVQAVAAQAGLSFTPRATDYGIDLSLYAIAQRGRRFVESGSVLDVQVKSSTRAIATPSEIRYDLEAKAYEDLRDPQARNPRIQVLVVFPSHSGQWLSQSEEGLTIHRCAYWLSLGGRESRSRARRPVRIGIPRRNVFSVPALLGIMQRIQTRDKP